MYNLRNRSFLKEVDFSPEEFRFLLRLSEALKMAKYAGTERRRLEGREIALIFEKTSTRTRCLVRGRRLRPGRSCHVPGPSGIAARAQGVHPRHRSGAQPVLRRHRVPWGGQAAVEELAEFADVPVWNGLTAEWHPTQMLADFMTMAEHAGRPFSEIAYTYMGDARSNMGHSLLVMGAIMGADVRICAPESLWPGDDVRALAQERAAASGARILVSDDPAEALPGAHFVHTDVWVSMGEPQDVWDERVELLRPYQVNARAMALTGEPDVKFMHCLPAYHDLNTRVGRQIADQTGLTDGIEVTGEVFDARANICFDQAENRLHTIKAEPSPPSAIESHVTAPSGTVRRGVSRWGGTTSDLLRGAGDGSGVVDTSVRAWPPRRRVGPRSGRRPLPGARR